jgi:hypothetical protein
MTVFLPKIYIFTDETWFHLSGYIYVQNSGYCSGCNPRETFEVSLHDQNIGVWCTITDTRILGPILFKTLLLKNRRETFSASTVMVFKQFICFQMCTYVFIMCGILAATYDSDDADVSEVKLATRVKGDFLVCGRLCDIYIYKQSLYTPWRRLRGRNYSSYSFLTLALDGGEWSGSRPGRA